MFLKVINFLSPFYFLFPKQKYLKKNLKYKILNKLHQNTIKNNT
jgi:hypothetical protein